MVNFPIIGTMSLRKWAPSAADKIEKCTQRKKGIFHSDQQIVHHLSDSFVKHNHIRRIDKQMNKSTSSVTS